MIEDLRKEKIEEIKALLKELNELKHYGYMNEIINNFKGHTKENINYYTKIKKLDDLLLDTLINHRNIIAKYVEILKKETSN